MWYAHGITGFLEFLILVMVCTQNNWIHRISDFSDGIPNESILEFRTNILTEYVNIENFRFSLHAQRLSVLKKISGF